MYEELASLVEAGKIKSDENLVLTYLMNEEHRVDDIES